MFKRILSTLIFAASAGCAYHLGLSERAIPGGYKQIAIPVFKNKSPEVGIEPLFTDALIRRFERSQVAHVTDSDSAPVTLVGIIQKVETFQGTADTSAQLPTLPQDAVLATSYRIKVTAKIELKRKSDEKIIWTGGFSTEKVYNSPIIGTAVVNSADANYNQSARMQAIGLLAEDMMLEAHDRITENY